MKQHLSYGKQHIDESDIAAVVATLTSDALTQGPAVEKFEAALSAYVGVEHSIAVSNGTAALHLACLALELGKGDAVIVPAITFAATANSVLYAGATPIFADIDPATLCMSPASVEEAISLAKKEGLKPKAIFPVHYAGRPADLKDLIEIANRYGLAIVEDACHALGAQYRTDLSGPWQHVGSAPSHIGVFSFHPVKHITTGEGGCLATGDSKLAKRLRMLRSHGITKDSDDFLNFELSSDQGSRKPEKSEVNPWYHEMQLLGFNYRLCDIQAALGISQMQRIHAFVGKRRALADEYRKLLRDDEKFVLPPGDDELSRHSYHLFPLQIDFKNIGITRRVFMERLKSKGVGTQVHYLPVYWHPFYAKNPQLWRSVSCANAHRFYEQTISLPLHPSLSEDDVAYCVETIRNAIAQT